jgi:Na+-transporting methylmalonyl-CoA/oxaloacetate decarboxylase gamma subunit
MVMMFIAVLLIVLLVAGMAQFVSRFAEPGDPEYAPPVPTCETKVWVLWLSELLFVSCLCVHCIASGTYSLRFGQLASHIVAQHKVDASDTLLRWHDVC